MLLRPAVSPPPPYSCLCMLPSPAPPISSDTGPIMTFEDPPTPKSCGTYKDRTPGKKALMVRRSIPQPAQPLLSPDRRRDRQSVTYRSKAAKTYLRPDRCNARPTEGDRASEQALSRVRDASLDQPRRTVLWDPRGRSSWARGHVIVHEGQGKTANE